MLFCHLVFCKHWNFVWLFKLKIFWCEYPKCISGFRNFPPIMSGNDRDQIARVWTEKLCIYQIKKEISLVWNHFCTTFSIFHSQSTHKQWKYMLSPYDSNGDVSTSESSSNTASCWCRPCTFLTSTAASSNIYHHITEFTQRQFTLISKYRLCTSIMKQI